jgi:DNA-binding IclR family transcriptional regulator
VVLQRDNTRFLDGTQSDLPLRVGVRKGEQTSAYCLAGGKALRAELTNADLDVSFQVGCPHGRRPGSWSSMR